MPTYATPSPIDLAINLPVGAIEVVAADRTDTVVTVSPTNPAKATTSAAPRRRRSTSTASGSPSRDRGRGSPGSAPTSRSTCSVELPGRVAAHRRGRRSAACAPPDGSARPASRARWARWTSRPPTTCGCAPRTATSPSVRPRAAPRSRPTTARSGSARSPATRCSRRRTAASGSTSPRRRRREALLRRPGDHQGARLGRDEDRLRQHPAARGVERLRPGRERFRPGRRRRAARRRRLARPGLQDRARAQPARGRPRPRRVRAVRRVRARTQAGDITVQRAR